MEWLNYHHLQCFWLVARRGGLAAAGKELHVSPSTVWVQLKAIEERLGLQLLEKRGRSLALTDQGERVARVADELFALGRDVLALARGDEDVRTPLRVGVVASLPRLVASRLVAPALRASFRLKLHHGTAVQLLGELAANRIDVVLSDEAPSAGPVRAYSQLVGSSRLAFFCGAELQKKLAPRFPSSLDGAPALLPPFESAQRRGLDAELARLKVRLKVLAEVDDSALIKTLAASGFGVVPAPELVRDELRRLYGLHLLGRLSVTESYFAVTLERKLRHPAVEAMIGGVRDMTRRQPRSVGLARVRPAKARRS